MVKRLWPIGVVVALAGSAALGVLTANVDDLQATVEHPPKLNNLLREIPQYPGSFFYPMGTELHVDGKPREMAHALTKDPVAKVADRYEAIWTSRGHLTDRHVEETEEWVVASDIADPTVRTVVITESEQGTVIIASLSEKFATSSTRIPVPPGCTVMRSTGAQDGDVLSEMSLITCEATISEVLGFYDRAVAGANRITHRAPTIERKDAHVTYNGSGLQVGLIASQGSEEPPRTAITITWQVKR